MTLLTVRCSSYKEYQSLKLQIRRMYFFCNSQYTLHGWICSLEVTVKDYA